MLKLMKFILSKGLVKTSYAKVPSNSKPKTTEAVRDLSSMIIVSLSELRINLLNFCCVNKNLR